MSYPFLSSEKARPSGRGPSSQEGKSRDLAALLSYGSPNSMPYVNAWTDSRIEQVRNFRHWIYVAINCIARKVATQMPNVSWLIEGKGSKVGQQAKGGLYKERKCGWPVLGPYVRSKALLPLQAHQNLQPVPYNHPLVRLLSDPNEPDTSWDLWYETLLFLYLTGSAYWWMPRNKAGLPVAIFVVPSHWIWPVMGGEHRFVEAWELRPIEGNYLKKRLPVEEVLHFRFKSPISKLDGYGPLTAGALWGDVMETIIRSRFHAYKNGSFPTVSVQFDGRLQDPSDEDLRRIEAKFLSRYVGENRTNKPLFLPPGVSVTPLVIKPNEMVFGETAAETRDNILALFGVPAVVAGISQNMTYGSNLAAMSNFYDNTVNPLCRFLGQVITEKLARRYEEDLRVWWEDMTPEDPEMREKRISTDSMCAAISPNEVRALRGREPWPYEWADGPIMPVNMMIGSATMPLGGTHDTNKPDVGLDMPAPKPTKPDKDFRAVTSRFELNGTL